MRIHHSERIKKNIKTPPPYNIILLKNKTESKKECEELLESMEEIIQEKISADHLLYVSLKYTKTCDVIQNLLIRWRKMIEIAIEQMLSHAKKKKMIKSVSVSPVEKLEQMKLLFKKNQDVMEMLELYEMFRKLELLKKERIGEFRKNVTLKVMYQGKEVAINLDKLKEYAYTLEKFITYVKQFLSS